MKRLVVILVSSLMFVQFTGCASNEQTGQVTGGLLGGLLGSQVGHGSGRTAAIIVGTIAGAYIGGSIGRSMDETDRLKSTQALESNRTNQPSSWSNPDNGNQYTVTPTRTYTADSGEDCREYTTDAVVDGRAEQVSGTACRQANGTWKAVN